MGGMMAMRSSPVDLPLSGGLDTRSDPKIAKGMLLCENGSMHKIGSVEKCKGFDRLPKTLINNGNTGNDPDYGWRPEGDTEFVRGYGLHVHRGMLLLIGEDAPRSPLIGAGLTTRFWGDVLAVFSPDVGRWLPLGIESPIRLDVLPRAQQLVALYAYPRARYAVGENYTAIIGVRPLPATFNAALMVSLYAHDGEAIYVHELVQADDVSAHDGHFLRSTPTSHEETLLAPFILEDPVLSGSLNCYVWNSLADRGSRGSVNTLHANCIYATAGTPVPMDTCISHDGESIIVAMADDTLTAPDYALRVSAIDRSGAVIASTVVAADVLVVVGPGGRNTLVSIVAVVVGGNKRYVVFWQDGVNVNVSLFDLALNHISTSISAVPLTTSKIHAVYWRSRGGPVANDYIVVSHVEQTAPPAVFPAEAYPSAYLHIISSDGVTYSHEYRVLHGHGIVDLLVIGNEVYVLALGCEGENARASSSLYLYRLSDAAIPPPMGAFPYYNPILCLAASKSYMPDASVWQEPCTRVAISGVEARHIRVVGSPSNAGAIPVGAAVYEDRISRSPSRSAGVAIGDSYCIGGGKLQTFDGSISDLGWHALPPQPTLTAGGGGSITGTVAYCIVYTWSDANGETHRSAPSVPAVISGLVASDVIVYAPLPHPFDLARLTTGACTMEVYRTTNGGSVFYGVGQILLDATLLGVMVAGLTDTLSDAAIVDNPPLYTTGGVLFTSAPPGGEILMAGGGRLWLVPYDDTSTVLYTKPKAEKLAPEFVPGQYIRVQDDGDNTGLAYMDGQLIVFKRRAIYVIVGDGPNALGVGSFSTPRKLAADAGCVDASSVLTFRDGTIFRSDAGYYLLDRSLQVQPVGLPVDKWAEYKVARAFVNALDEELWFILANERFALIYDYVNRAWFTRTFSHELVGGCIDDDSTVYLLTADGTVLRQRNVLSKEPLAVHTPWYRAGALAGWQRLKWVHITGELDSAFTVRIWYEFDDGGKTYCQTSKFGRSPGRRIVRVHPEKRKFTAMRFDIEQSGSKTDDIFSLTALSLAVADKDRLVRLRHAETK